LRLSANWAAACVRLGGDRRGKSVTSMRETERIVSNYESWATLRARRPTKLKGLIDGKGMTGTRDAATQRRIGSSKLRRVAHSLRRFAFPVVIYGAQQSLLPELVMHGETSPLVKLHAG